MVSIPSCGEKDNAFRGKDTKPSRGFGNISVDAPSFDSTLALAPDGGRLRAGVPPAPSAPRRRSRRAPWRLGESFPHETARIRVWIQRGTVQWST